jgi:hypothetical protein
LTFTSVTAYAQAPWGKVQSWTGTATIEATDAGTVGAGPWKLTYRATGPFTIADDRMRAGNYMMWPSPAIAVMSDPAKMKAATQTWKARIVATYETAAEDETGRRFTISCTADNQVDAKVGVMSNGVSAYTFTATPPEPEFKCTGRPGYRPFLRGFQQAVSVAGKQGEPGEVTNTGTTKVNTASFTLTFKMAPTK